MHGTLFTVIDASTRDVHITDQQKARAVRTAAHYAHNADDLRQLLDILGLTAADGRLAATTAPREPSAQRATPRRRQNRRL